ncbi:MAG: TonB-dependent receptor plug [Chitinophagaceae bacterium]|nr:TonB-dependent receptor plug [Chitinophagaceae bacterium]
MRTISCIIFLMAYTNISFCQDTLLLDPVSISASLKAVSVSRTGRNIVIIKGEQFAKLPVHSVDELLRYVPGIEVQMRGPMGSQSDIVIRGGTFQQVLVVLDGLRLNDPNSGHFTSYIPIAPSEIDRIEIVKGASSAIYGSEAVGGVIHIITKSFAAKIHEDKKSAAIQLAAGQLGLWTINAGGNYQKKHTTVSGGILSNNADGQPQRGTKGYFNNNTVSFSANHYFTDHLKVSVRTAYDKRKFSAQNFYTTFKSDTAKETVQSFWNQVNLTYEKNKNKFSIDGGYKQVKDEYAFNAAGMPNKNTSALLQLLATNTYSFSNVTAVTTGVQFQNKKIVSNDRGDHVLDQFGAFVILNKTVNNFSFTPSIRIDLTSATEFVPQINLSYKINNFQLRGSAGKTIRQADFTERYNNYNKTFVAGGSIGNPDLQAERSFSYEAGADCFLNFLKVSATVFKRDQENVIDYVPTPYSQMPRKINLSPAGTYALAKNIAKVNTTGIETDMQLSFQKIHATLGLLWLNSKSSDTIPSFYISSHAKFMSNFSVSYENKMFAISVNGIYKKRKAQLAPTLNTTLSPDYFLVNTKLEIFVLKNTSVFFEADNVFNKNYSDLLGSQMPGRWLMGGVKINW